MTASIPCGSSRLWNNTGRPATPATWAIEELGWALSDRRPTAPHRWLELLNYFNAEVNFTPLPRGTRGSVRIGAAKSLIEISTLLSAEERLFTVAHELAHIILLSFSRRPRTARMLTQLSHAQIEATCDAIARSLIIPPKWMLSELRAGGLKLDTYSRIAQECGVPLSVALSRAVELHAPTAHVSANRRDREWVVEEVIGLPPGAAFDLLRGLHLNGFKDGDFVLTIKTSRSLGFSRAELRKTGHVVQIVGHHYTPSCPVPEKTEVPPRIRGR